MDGSFAREFRSVVARDSVPIAGVLLNAFNFEGIAAAFNGVVESGHRGVSQGSNNPFFSGLVVAFLLPTASLADKLNVSQPGIGGKLLDFRVGEAHRYLADTPLPAPDAVI